jgi:hypothetical protein
MQMLMALNCACHTLLMCVLCCGLCADVVQTPTMTLPLLPGCDASAATLLTARMRRLKLAETLKGIKVSLPSTRWCWCCHCSWTWHAACVPSAAQPPARIKQHFQHGLWSGGVRQPVLTRVSCCWMCVIFSGVGASCYRCYTYAHW